MWYLDTNVVVYLVERRPYWGQAAAARLGASDSSADAWALSDLTRMECRVGPLRHKDLALLKAFDEFFAASRVRLISMTAAVFDRAAILRADCGIRALGALHLAAALESGCDAFLTNDLRLSKFPGIRVEMLSSA